MDALDEQIGREIKRISRSGEWQGLMMGTVVSGSADLAAMTCSVQLITDTDTPTEGVLLNGVTDSDLGVVTVPKDGTAVWVARIDGDKYGIVRCSEVDKVLVKIGDVAGEISNGKVYWKQGAGELTIQGGKLQWKNGSGDLKTGVDNLMTHLLALTVTTPVGPSGPPINAADLTNDKTYFDNLLF